MHPSISSETHARFAKPEALTALRGGCCFPPIENFVAWGSITSDPQFAPFVKRIIELAERYQKESFPELRATCYMEFRRTGNRSHFEQLYFMRRRVLATLFLAEAFEGFGRFLDAIADWTWLILGEPTWCLPAHTNTADPLPDPGDEIVDLFSAQTAQLLALVYALGKNRLEIVSLNLPKWIRKTIIERTIEPIEDHIETFFWARGQNNWTPWVCSNVLCAGLAVLDGERLQAYVQKLILADGRFYERYSNDGGCDEGPGYWAVSPFCHFLFCEQLYQASGGAIKLTYGDEKFRLMAEYPANAWIGKKWVVPFADSGARMSLSDDGVLRRFAERAGNPKMLKFLDCFYTENPPRYRSCGADKSFPVENLLRTIANLVWTHEPASENVAGYTKPKEGEVLSGARPEGCHWYPILQALYAKSGRIFLAAKGGNNGENHNHLDVGQFIIGVDDEPVVIDMGSTEYTRFTFSPQRYEHPILSSVGHNVLMFDSFGQHPSDQSRATDLSFEETEHSIRLAMSLESAYSAEVGVSSYRREIDFDKAVGVVTVHDTWKLLKKRKPVLRLYTRTPLANGTFSGSLAFDSSAPFETEEFPVTDSRMLESWGKLLYRTTIWPTEGDAGELTLRFSIR